MMTTDVNDFLMGAGIASFKFDEIGAMVRGIIADTQLREQTDIATGEVLTWNDGNPRMQLVITIQTEQFDDEEDDGLRRVYAKGQMLGALREAIKAVGEKGIADGAKIAVKYVGDGEATQRGWNPPKQYQVWYEAPTHETAIPDDEDAPF